MPLTKLSASDMNNPSRDNSSEPGYAAANSLRLRSVSRDGVDLSMLCIATSKWARTAPHAAGGLRRHDVPVLPATRHDSTCKHTSVREEPGVLCAVTCVAGAADRRSIVY
jgi:hypothetical protein